MPTKPTAAVLMFPGTNCEQEAVAALRRVGFATTLLRWNEARTGLTKYDFIMIAGGFSFEDRGRSGLIASRDPAMKAVAAAAKVGRVVLGVCNGAQVLVETGLVPGGEFGQSTVALAHNHLPSGESFYVNQWVHLVSPVERGTTPFNNFEGMLTCPIAHGEGRFATRDPALVADILAHGQNLFCYATEGGDIDPRANPNGSIINLAGLSNPAGNVMALMPHPERSEAGDAFFIGIKKWIQQKKKYRAVAKGYEARPPKIAVQKRSPYKTELITRLTITDNEAISMEQLLTDMQIPLRLTKYRFFGFDRALPRAELEALIRSGSHLNTEKETAWVRQGAKVFRYDKTKGLVRSSLPDMPHAVLATDSSDHTRGHLWVAAGSKKSFDAAVKASVFHNPTAEDIFHFEKLLRLHHYQ